MATWLIYPPFADPTQPYMSLPYLKASLKGQGLDATVVDLNVAAAHHLLGRENVKNCARQIGGRFEALNACKKLTRMEAMEYVSLADARPAARRLLAAGSMPLEILQDPDRFYDFAFYRKARNLSEDVLACTSAAAFPFRIGFNHATHLAVPWAPDLLESYFQNRQSPLDAFYRSFLKGLSLHPGDVVGINLTFISQIPEVFYIVQLLRQMIPSLFLVIGGSCLQQMLQHGTEAAREWVVSVADAACLFEGEETLPLLIKALNQEIPGRNPEMRRGLLEQVPNLLFRKPDGSGLQSGPMRISDLKSLSTPDYADLDLDQYLAPERTLLFSPARGCYWNRCAFCDYGLNRSQCHGYREMAADEAARQLVGLSRQYGVRNFYLSVDVMAPRFALDLARALVRHKADIRWSADFRIEDTYSADRCALLYQSGLRAVAFGVESGSDRVLRQMDKGISVRLTQEINARFHQSGIATAWMTFSGHPGESRADSLATARLIQQEQNRISQFILGQFGLTSGSLIAGHPGRFGLKNIYYCRGDAFRLFPLYESEESGDAEPDASLEKAVDRLSRVYWLDHYPWAGAISTHHSFLYLLRYGPRVFHRPDFPLPGKRSSSGKGDSFPGLTMRPKFSIERLRRENENALQTFFQGALAGKEDGDAALDQAHFLKFFA